MRSKFQVSAGQVFVFGQLSAFFEKTGVYTFEYGLRPKSLDRQSARKIFREKYVNFSDIDLVFPPVTGEGQWNPSVPKPKISNLNKGFLNGEWRGSVSFGVGNGESSVFLKLRPNGKKGEWEGEFSVVPKGGQSDYGCKTKVSVMEISKAEYQMSFSTSVCDSVSKTLNYRQIWLHGEINQRGQHKFKLSRYSY